MPGECPKDTTLASTLLNPWQKVLGFLNVRVRVEKPAQMMLKVSIQSASRYVCWACLGLCVSSGAPASTYLGRDVEL